MSDSDAPSGWPSVGADGDTGTAPDGEPSDRDDTEYDANRDLADRIAAVERAVGRRPPSDDHDHPADPVRLEELDEIGDRLDAVEKRLDEIDASVQALRGYAGSVRAVEEEIERRADLALAVARKAAATVDSASRDSAAKDSAAHDSGEVGTDDSVTPEDVVAAAATSGPDEAVATTDAPAESARGGLRTAAGDVADEAPDDPAVAAAVPGGGEGGTSCSSTGAPREREGTGTSDGVLARLRDVL